MPYKYVAYTADGDIIRGNTDAVSPSLVEEMLWRSDYYITSVQEVPPPINWRELFPTLLGVKTQEVIVLTRQLATLIRSGVSIVRALSILREQVSNSMLSNALGEIVAQIETGVPVSAALSRYPLIFPEIYTRMVEVGERTGHLEEVLEQVATYIEKSNSITGKIRGALM